MCSGRNKTYVIITATTAQILNESGHFYYYRRHYRTALFEGEKNTRGAKSKSTLTPANVKRVNNFWRNAEQETRMWSNRIAELTRGTKVPQETLQFSCKLRARVCFATGWQAPASFAPRRLPFLARVFQPTQQLQLKIRSGEEGNVFGIRTLCICLSRACHSWLNRRNVLWATSVDDGTHENESSRFYAYNASLRHLVGLA